ncbi:dipeptidase [Parvularcula sp. LCG005]|uniref:dipeptidase n=1 Tax=Parvularcula sp. LCG005 TaxID=3078805 RepID=UPI002942ADD3|nr:dipeptidase [Parvularcula sp. LCG005]WOI53949.1 dipeptidase [Parvularcula sp. LCG005]
MKRITQIGILVVLLLLIIGAVAIFWIVPAKVDRNLNAVVAHDPWPVSAKAQALHDTIPVADLHADTFLWMRDPRDRHGRGHVDLPRMREGGMFLQLFTVVTKSPPDLNYEENTSEADDITLLAFAQRWPIRTYDSLLERARFQAARLRDVVQTDDDVFLVLTRADLAAAEARRASHPGTIAALLGTEGAHPLEGQPENIDVLYADGYRVMGLQHFFDNELGGSLHGITKAGLTDFGRAAVARMEERGVIIDVAHSSEAVVREVLAMTDRPVILSHTGFKGACDSARNISDELMAQIAARGGLIGVGFWDDAVCDGSPDGVAAMIKYGIDHFGEDAIALGGDYDGSVTTYFDVSELPALTDALLRAGLTDDQVVKVMGGNTLRFFLAALPEELN